MVRVNYSEGKPEMKREDIEMTTVHVYGHPFEVPKLLADGWIAEKRRADEAGEREAMALRMAYEVKHGPIPAPDPRAPWVEA